MEELIKKLSKNIGYTITDIEIKQSYTNGDLILTDEEENTILKYFNF